MATVAGDVPAVSSKWEEITFEALANKTTTVDQTIIDGSTNAVSGNAVFDALASKSNIGHTHVASQITDLSKASVGLGNVDNTSDLSKPLSTATINALATKFQTPTGLTTNYLPKWNGSGFVDSSIDSSFGVTRISSTSDNVPLSIISNQTEATIGFKSNSSANAFNVRLGAEGEDFMFRTLNFERLRIKANGRVLINKTGDDLTNQLQVAGTISASPATTANQVVVKSQLDAFVPSGTVNLTGNQTISGVKTFSNAITGTTANFSGTVTVPAPINPLNAATKQYVDAAARPYKVYTALYSQNGTSNPTVVILENTLGTVTFTRSSTGVYFVNSSGLFTADKTFVIMGAGINANYTNAINLINSSTFSIITKVSSTQADADSANTKVAFEIRVYN